MTIDRQTLRNHVSYGALVLLCTAAFAGTALAGDKPPVVTVPLTDGFARTGYEQQYLETLEQQRERGEKPGEQAALGSNR